jgi:hypothetical protein
MDRAIWLHGVGHDMNRIEFRADHGLSDTLALQLFVLRNHLLRRGLVLAILMLGGLAITTLMNGAPLADSLADLKHNAGLYLALVLVGLAVIYMVALIFAVLAWRRQSKPRQIRATITGSPCKKTASAMARAGPMRACWPNTAPPIC